MKFLVLIMFVLISVLIWTQYQSLQSVRVPQSQTGEQAAETQVVPASRNSNMTGAPGSGRVTNTNQKINRSTSYQSNSGAQRYSLAKRNSQANSSARKNNQGPAGVAYNQSRAYKPQSFNPQTQQAQSSKPRAYQLESNPSVQGMRASAPSYSATARQANNKRLQQELAYEEGRMNPVASYQQSSASRASQGSNQNAAAPTGPGSISAYKINAGQPPSYSYNQGANSARTPRGAVTNSSVKSQSAVAENQYRKAGEPIDCSNTKDKINCR